MSFPYESTEVGVAALGSMTAALKAQRALTAAGLSLTVVSLSPSDTRRGCAYGVEFPLSLEGRVRTALQDARIPVSQYMRKRGKRL
jgi:hypothetical protein